MDSATVIYKGQSYTAKYASFEIAAAANSDVVAAVTLKCILVTGLWIAGTTGTVADVTFSSNATPLVPVVHLAAAGHSMPVCGFQYFKTVAGEKLNVAAAAAGVWGKIQYIEVDS